MVRFCFVCQDSKIFLFAEMVRFCCAKIGKIGKTGKIGNIG